MSVCLDGCDQDEVEWSIPFDGSSHLKGCSLAGSNFSGVCGQQLTQHVVEEEELGHAFILQDSQFLALYVVIRSYSSGSLRSSVL